MGKSLHKRLQDFRDGVGVPITKIAESANIEPVYKMYNFVAGSSLKDNDAINLHEYLKEMGY